MKSNIKPYEIAEIGRRIGQLEALIIWLIDHWWWEAHEGQNEREFLEYLCEMTELWGKIEDLERKE